MINIKDLLKVLPPDQRLCVHEGRDLCNQWVSYFLSKYAFDPRHRVTGIKRGEGSVIDVYLERY